jgi:two-component system cell cycle response regulator
MGVEKEFRMRITKKVFHDLAIWMVGFGLAIGLVFPLFVMALGVPSNVALTPTFFAACICAGVIAGLINFLMARLIVGERIRLLAVGMRHVEDKLKAMAISGRLDGCTPDSCSIVVDSEDEIGDSARAFNLLVTTLASAMETEAAYRGFSKMLTSNLELKPLLEKALAMFLEHSGSLGGAILYESGGELSIAASYGLKDPDRLIDSDHVLAVMQKGKPESVAIPEGIQLAGVLADFTPQEVCILPANYKDVPLGIIVLGASNRYSVDQQARMALFSDGLGLAMNNALAHDRLKRLAALDSLTGMYNRRFGMGRLHEEFSRAVRANVPLGVVMMDIDHFKAINDTYGHMVGDRVLKLVAGGIRAVLREGDILMRYGGEEFMAVFPAASGEDLSRLGERIRRTVEDSSLTAGNQTVRVTLSLGGAAYPDHPVENESSLVQLADKALYCAKESGRNRLELARAVAEA